MSVCVCKDVGVCMWVCVFMKINHPDGNLKNAHPLIHVLLVVVVLVDMEKLNLLNNFFLFSMISIKISKLLLILKFEAN